MKLGLVITAYNRPEYLDKCLSSLKKANIPKWVKILIVDDCSTDERTIQLIQQSGYNSIKTKSNMGVSGALLTGFEKLTGLTHYMTLDADAIVNRNFIERIREILTINSKAVFSGFNTSVKGRHEIVEKGENWVKRITAGGINLAFSKETYLEHIKPALQQTINGGNWDNIATRNAGGVYCTIPSCVQHIGMQSTLRHNNPDVANDFIPDKEWNTTDGKGKTAIIAQYFGLGDVIFSMGIANRLIEDGYKVLWGVMPEFVEGLNTAYPNITFVDYNLLKVDWNMREDVTRGTIRYIPLRWTIEIMRVPFRHCMRSKYDYMGLDWTTWRNAKYVRNMDKEKRLFNELGLVEGQYTIVNRTFRSNSQGRANIQVQGVEMRNIPKYSMFDWGYVLENAADIHTVSTSIIYLLELLTLQCEPTIYLRQPDERNHDNYKYIMTKNKYKWQAEV